MAITGPNPASEGASDLGLPPELLHEAAELPPGVGPWELAWRRLRRNRVALAFGGLFLVIVVLCLLAPVYSNDIAHIGPNTENLTGQITVGGKTEYVVSLTDIPIGPTWDFHHYFLGADGFGRDVAVRLLYGGRTSLEVGAIATLITMVFGVTLALIAGFYRGWLDQIFNRVMDLIWSYPVVLLGLTLGTIIAIHGLGPFKSPTPVSTALIVGFIYIPYVFRPVRGQVLGLREREFVDAARQQGLSSVRIMASEILPNLSSTVVVFVPLILANAILLEAALSFLGAGIQPPNASWGTMITDGINELPAAFHNVLVPGIMLVLTVMSVNIFGDGLRDAFDPRARVRIAISSTSQGEH